MRSEAAIVQFLNDLRLDDGSHTKESNRFCTMEAVAWISDRRHSDYTGNASLVIGAFVRHWTDDMGDERTGVMLPLIRKIANTNPFKVPGPGEPGFNPKANDGKRIEETRLMMIADWAARVAAPTWIEFYQPNAFALALRNAPQIVSRETSEHVFSIMFDNNGILHRLHEDERILYEARHGSGNPRAGITIAHTKSFIDRAALGACVVALSAIEDRKPSTSFSTRGVAYTARLLAKTAGRAKFYQDSNNEKIDAGEREAVVSALQVSAADLVLRLCEVKA